MTDKINLNLDQLDQSITKLKAVESKLDNSSFASQILHLCNEDVLGNESLANHVLSKTTNILKSHSKILQTISDLQSYSGALVESISQSDIKLAKSAESVLG